MLCTGSYFYLDLMEAMIQQFQSLLPDQTIQIVDCDEPRDYHHTLPLLSSGQVQLVIWPEEDFPGEVSAELDYFKVDRAYLIFKKANSCLMTLRQAYAFPVSFIGAGPGEPEWLTLEAMYKLQNCDVCFYDALVNKRILQHLPEEAEKKFVGKRGDSKSFDQTELNYLIFNAVRDGKKVVRLKGGDAGILGRIQDEVDLLIEHELSWSITPGITAAQALAPCTGTYLTSRGVSDRVILTTARQAGGGMSQLMHFNRATLVIYMGVLSIEKIVAQLREAGYPEDLPAMIATNLGRIDVAEYRGQLSSIAQVVQENNIRPPGLIVFGDTTGIKNMPSFSPLLGRRILVLGDDEVASKVEDKFLRGAGAKPIFIEHPELYTKERTLPFYDDIIFLTPRAVYEFNKYQTDLPENVNFAGLNQETVAVFDCLYDKPIVKGDKGGAAKELRIKIFRDHALSSRR